MLGVWLNVTQTLGTQIRKVHYSMPFDARQSELTAIAARSGSNSLPASFDSSFLLSLLLI